MGPSEILMFHCTTAEALLPDTVLSSHTAVMSDRLFG